MMRSHSCPKCQGTMAEGYMLSERQSMRVVAGWVSGAPQRGWFGLKRVGKPIDIASWRCQRCGFLENYARD